MAQTYIQIHQQIASLQRRAETLRLEEVKSAIGKAKAIIARFALTAEQLGLAVVSAKPSAAPVFVKTRAPATVVKKAVAPAAKTTKSPVAKKAATPIRYRDNAGNTWGGRGPKPRWLVAGIAAGRTLESLATSK
jgi:DNA-binding protein H-NS